MKGIFKNIILLIIVLVLSHFSASCFGGWYNKFSPLYDRSLLSLTTQELFYFIGFPLAYIFFIIFLFKLFGQGNKKKWIGWLVAPAVLFFAVGDLKHMYVPVAVGVAAWVVARVLQEVWVRVKLR